MSLRCASAGTTDLLPILVCIQYVKERFLSFAEDDGFEPPPRLAFYLCWCMLSAPFLSVNLPNNVITFLLSLVLFEKPANLAADWLVVNV